MTCVPVLALSKWAHHSWLPHGKCRLSERAQAHANASLLASFPQLIGERATPNLPPFAMLPRPVGAKVLRVAASLAHACSLRRVVTAAARELFAIRIAPRVLSAVQRDARGELGNVDVGETLSVFDRTDMAAVGLLLALHSVSDPSLRVLIELRFPRTMAQRAAHFGVGDISERAARELLDDAHGLVRGEAC
jgi:hypothetical protein